jgi:hypothetical protein
LAPSKHRETKAQWQRAAELLLGLGDVADLSKQIDLALFYDAKLDVAVEGMKAALTLQHASRSRPSGEWRLTVSCAGVRCVWLRRDLEASWLRKPLALLGRLTSRLIALRGD